MYKTVSANRWELAIRSDKTIGAMSIVLKTGIIIISL